MSYRILGTSGLRVSPIALGTLTFGTEWGIGSPADVARSVFLTYVESGGNFFDTADIYSEGNAETLLGQFIREVGDRDRFVISSKVGFTTRGGDPNAFGASRKKMLQAVEASLRRLGTDYVDVLTLHAWDQWTSAEETMRVLDTLVRDGKARYVAMSNVPAWFFARAQSLGMQLNHEPICAMQLEYSLVERSAEREHFPAARALGASICAWSPMSGGFLTGRYALGPDRNITGEGRLQLLQATGHPLAMKFTERNWRVLAEVKRVAEKLGWTPGQVALRWVLGRPGIASALVGARAPEQLRESLKATTLDLPAELASELDAATAPESCTPYVFQAGALDYSYRGGVAVSR